MEERYILAKNRIEELLSERILPSLDKDFFIHEADFIFYALQCYEKARDGELCKLSIKELRAMNSRLYNDLVYINNPILSALSAEIRAMIPYIFEKDLENILIRTELFLEFLSAYAAAEEDGSSPKDEELKSILYYYVSDYTDMAVGKKLKEMLVPKDNFAISLLTDLDWNDVKSLYMYGEYVTGVEEKTLNYLNSLPYETLKKMADTFTEGYRIGFIATNKDISKKKTVGIRYSLGFEPVVRIAVENFKNMGLDTTLARARFNLLNGRGMVRIGFQGACPSRQYDFEHKDDQALVLDSKLVTVKLEALKRGYERLKEEASVYGGPAVMEVFGEEATEYVSKEYAPTLSASQVKLTRKYTAEAMAIQNEYIKEEERSFTIIAFPTPDIGEDFEAIFDEVIKINTLDYKLYQKVQQVLIDTLDRADYAIVKGRGGNKTNLRVSLHKLGNPEKETKFENCVADVNIPVGEVFTSPVLKGTEGILNVKKVYLNGLEYKNIMLTIKDGMLVDYTCDNFPTEEENRKFIFDNVLFRHEALPMGEFAIGTNTTAYTVSRKYNIADKLPILIAEKTGPHFAFGDTCYSHAEDVKVYNPDGKEIISKDNECSLKRDTEPDKAYFNCHTDVTLPYDELGEVSIVTYDDEVITIIENGVFVLPGTEELNKALEDL